MDLTPGQRVLDVGCGIGGSCFYMAEKYGAEVLALDLSRNMLSIAKERLKQLPEDVKNRVSSMKKVSNRS